MADRYDITQALGWIQDEFQIVEKIMDGIDGYDSPTETFVENMNEVRNDIQTLANRFDEFYRQNIENKYGEEDEKEDSEPDEAPRAQPMNETERLHQRLREVLRK
jgi:hypothetical protein